MWPRFISLLLFILITLAGAGQASFDVLVFSKTNGFRHSSIPAGQAAIEKLSVEMGFNVQFSEDSTAFTEDNLDTLEVVIFLNTTGDILDDTGQDAFKRFIENGGGFIGIHSATDTEYDWPWYGKLVGAYFDSHPAIQQAGLNVIDANHPSTAHLPAAWTREDEWYNFKAPLAPSISVLVTIDEQSYDGGAMGDPHPISWYQEFSGGRSFYTAMGHTEASYAEQKFLDHLMGGIKWVSQSMQ